ncbi:MAG TPA: anti-sigma factor [Candidatus Acidoferrum sp.]|nr:anti-sigma factor [Candidatus Acidoferrum sp.]
MSPSPCEEFSKHLESWLEESHDPVMEAHVRSCARCNALVEDLGAIRATAFEWAYPEDEPSPSLWTSLRAQLEAEGLIHVQTTSWWDRLTSWVPSSSRPVLAGAYVAILVAVAFAISGPGESRLDRQLWLQSAENTSQPLQQDLDLAEQATVSTLPQSNSPVTASLQKNLAVVDNYIVLCEKSVRDDPQDEVAREYLFDAYQQKADLLAVMSERGDYEQ